MELTTPGPEHAALARLAGRWSGSETQHPASHDSTRRPSFGRFEMRMVCDGLYLVSDYVESIDNEVVYRGHGVYGWEPHTERYTMFWFDSLGGGGAVKPVLGTFEDDRLCFQHTLDVGFKRYVYELVSDEEFTFRMEFSEDGAVWTTPMDGRYRPD